MTDNADFVFKGRWFTDAELELVEEVVCTCSGLSVRELGNTISELLDWRRPSGRLKTSECCELLIELSGTGRLRLPAARPGRPRGSRTVIRHTEEGERRPTIRGSARDVGPISLRRVRSPEDRDLWRELIDRHHYLGHKVPFGAHLRYLIEVSRPNRAVAGCLQLSSPAWKMAARDHWIGWTDGARRSGLQRIVNNSRFLLLPWFEVKNLASAVLAVMARTFPEDWQATYGVDPVLLETLVETGRHNGTCYRAANWIALGVTTGRGRMDRERRRLGRCPKRIFVYPLRPDAREVLRGGG